MRSSSIAAKSTGSISGISSRLSVYSRSAPSSNLRSPISGCIAGRTPSSSIALEVASSIVDWRTSPLTASPKRVRSTASGTLPARKPGTRTSRPTSLSRATSLPSMSAAGTLILYSRLSPSAADLGNLHACLVVGGRGGGGHGAGGGTRTPKACATGS